MDEQIYEKIYNELVKLLIDNQLSWVIDQVTEELRVGVLEAQSIRVKTFEEIPPHNSKNTSNHSVLKQTGRTANFLTVREYTSKERVLLLIDAFKRATADITMMANAIFVLLSDGNQQVDAVRFIGGDSKDASLVEYEKVSSQLERVLSELRTRSGKFTESGENPFQNERSVGTRSTKGRLFGALVGTPSFHHLAVF